MKSSYLFFLGLIAVLLSALFLINPMEFQISNFNQVFAQSEEKNKNFDDAITSHSSGTITGEKIKKDNAPKKNFDDAIVTYLSETVTGEKTKKDNAPKKNFDDTIISQSSDAAPKEKSKDDNDKNRNFDEAILTHSSDTSSIVKQNKDKTSFIGRLPTSEYIKIHPAITQILEHANPKAMAKIYGASIDNDHLYVYVHLADNQIQNKPSDIEILAQDKNIIVSKLSFSQIKSLADLDSIERITLPDLAVFDAHDVSEGVSFSMADEMHMLGFDGTGIRVAVIDDSFFITNPEISSNIVHSELFDSLNLCNGDITCGEPLDGSHGTAVAEILGDMAPGAEKLLYAIGNSVDFNNAVDDAMNRNADIITASLGFPTLGGDGSDPDKWFRDGTSSVAKKVNAAKTNGILFTVAAGNQGESHWSGTYAPNSTRMPEPLNSDLVSLTSQVGFVGYESVMIFNSTTPTPTLNSIALYNFEGDVQDSTGNANHGTINIGGTETYVTGQVGDSFDFDGSTTVQIDSGLVTTNAEYTIASWVKKASGSLGSAAVVYGEENSSSTTQTKLMYWGENFGNGNVKLRIFQRDSSGVSNSDSFDSGIAITDTVWHHIAWVQTSATSYDVYVDGAKIGTKTELSLGGTFTPDSNNIGSRPNDSQFYTGQMDVFGIFDFELTAEQVIEFLVTDSMKACLPVTANGDRFVASWNAWDLTTEDYDLILYGPNMIDFKNVGSFIPQDPDNLPPVESFSSAPIGDACLVLAKFSGAPNLNHFFHIDMGTNGLNSSFIISPGSIDTPADATGALSVGAVNHSSDLFETFSSQGPTDDGRLKPEICGPDRTLTHQTALNPPAPGTFPGTSASTPHVAGAAALLLDVNPDQTVDELKQKLIDNARFNASYSQNNLCGSDSIPRSGTVSLENILDPKLKFPFNGNVLDDSGNANHGTVIGNEQFTTGLDGQAFDFDGSTTVQIDSGLVTTNAEYSITTWVKKASGSLGSAAVVYGEENSSSVTQTKLMYWGDDFGNGNVKLRIFQRDSSGVSNSGSFDSGIPITNTEWHHIAWVQTSATSYDVYVDGAKIGTKTGLSLGGTFTPDSNNVGSRPNNSQFYTGQMDDVQVYRFELTDIQVFDLFDSLSIVSHYQFEHN